MPHNLLYLHNPHTVSWLQSQGSGQVLVQATQQALSDVPFNHADAVLLPTTDIVLLDAEMPTRQRQRIVQALPYALEDQLATDVETLHFALGQQDKLTQRITAAVITQVRFEAYIEVLQQTHIHAQQLIPDVLAVPLPETGWGILFLDDVALIRTGKQQGFSCEREQLTTWLHAAMRDTSPAQFMIYRGTHAENLTVLHGIGIPLVEQVHPDGALAWLVQGLDASRLNLLQGRYRPQRQQATTYWRQWRWTLILTLLWGMWSLGKLWLDVQALKQQRTELNQAIESLYKQAFPDAKRIVNARVQMQQKLQVLQAQTEDKPKSSQALVALMRLAPALAAAKPFDLQMLQYRQGSLDVRLKLKDLQRLEQLKQQLQAQQFDVAIQSAQSQNNQVDARLHLKLNKSN